MRRFLASILLIGIALTSTVTQGHAKNRDGIALISMRPGAGLLPNKKFAKKYALLTLEVARNSGYQELTVDSTYFYYKKPGLAETIKHLSSVSNDPESRDPVYYDGHDWHVDTTSTTVIHVACHTVSDKSYLLDVSISGAPATIVTTANAPQMSSGGFLSCD